MRITSSSTFSKWDMKLYLSDFLDPKEKCKAARTWFIFLLIMTEERT